MWDRLASRSPDHSNLLRKTPPVGCPCEATNQLYCSRSTIGFPRQPPNFSVTRPNVSGASWSARRHALSEAGCLCPRSAVRSRPGGMTGRERAARTRTSTALRRIAVFLSGATRHHYTVGEAGCLCAQACRPPPSCGGGRAALGRHEAPGGTARALRASRTARTVRSDAAIALTADRRKYTRWSVGAT
jgi:hypothetical protein